jgi:hypothetical protein
VHGGYASGTDAHAQPTHQNLNGLAPPKIKVTSLYFSPKVTDPERLYGLKIMKIRAKVSPGDYNLVEGPFKDQSPHLTKFYLPATVFPIKKDFLRNKEIFLFRPRRRVKSSETIYESIRNVNRCVIFIFLLTKITFDIASRTVLTLKISIG